VLPGRAADVAVGVVSYRDMDRDIKPADVTWWDVEVAAARAEQATAAFRTRGVYLLQFWEWARFVRDELRRASPFCPIPLRPSPPEEPRCPAA
jgi:hypothetical protein